MSRKRVKTERPVGRPVEYPMPDPIPDTVENVPSTIFAGPPKNHWRYLEQRKAVQRSPRTKSA